MFGRKRFSGRKRSIGNKIFGPLSRSAPLLSLVLLISFLSITFSLGYYLLALSPREFAQQKEVKGYENDLKKLETLDEWTITTFYWSNNLRVAGISIIFFPSYFANAIQIASGRSMGMAIAYFDRTGGWQRALAFSAQLFVHGIFEFTGLLLISAGTMRLAWRFWERIGRIKNFKKFFIKRSISPQVKSEITDAGVILLLGLLLIFIAAPVEAYISPTAGVLFFFEPALALLFLASVCAVYFAIFLYGLEGMKAVMKKVAGETKEIFNGRVTSKNAPAVIFLLAMILYLSRYFIR
ncbi:MAG: stage II sporulation protein M [Candidatus Hadarchaeales archaeon]